MKLKEKTWKGKLVAGFRMCDIELFCSSYAYAYFAGKFSRYLFLIFIVEIWKRSYDVRSCRYVEYKQFKWSIHQKPRGINERSFVLLLGDERKWFAKKGRKTEIYFIYFPASFYIISYHKDCSENALSENLTGCY